MDVRNITILQMRPGMDAIKESDRPGVGIKLKMPADPVKAKIAKSALDLLEIAFAGKVAVVYSTGRS